MNETMQCMQRHASVRSFTDEPVDASLLEELIRCGQAASSSSFIQAYSIVRVVDGDNRRHIARAAGNQRWIVEAAEFLVFCADLQRIRYSCAKAEKGELQGHTEHFITATIDAALMAQNVLLAAESAELGGVFIGGIRNDPQTVSECLQLPELVYPAFGMCLGWPDQRQAPKPRLPTDSILHQDHYDATRISQDVEDYDRAMAAYYASRQQNPRSTEWSSQSAQALLGKTRDHMLGFLQRRGFLLR